MKQKPLRRSLIALAPVATALIAWNVAPLAHGSPAIAPQADDPSLLTKVSNCETPKTDVVVQENPIPPTSNQSPVNPTTVQGMSKTVTVGGSGPTCVVVNVTAVAFAQEPADQPYDALNLTVWMDGHVGHPAEYQFAASGGQLGDAHGANFVFKKVNPGVHTFTLKMWTALGGQASITTPTMTIMHR